MRNLHSRFPAAVLFQELIKNSVTGRQVYNIYLGKHNVSKQISGNARNMDLPTPSSIIHFGLSPSSWFKKDPVPIVFDGVFISYIEIRQSILPDITKVN